MAPIKEGETRGHEIQEYLLTSMNVESFVIIDDEEEMGHLREYLIETDFRTGINEETVEKVVARLS